MLEIGNYGWSDFDSLQLSVNKRFSRGHQYRLAYTLSRTYGNTGNPGNIETITTQVLDDLNLEQGESRTAQDRPHVLSAGGSIEVPHTHGLVVSSGIIYQSGTPFTLVDSTTDPDRNGNFQEPLPAGSYTALVASPDAYTVDNKGGFRGARGPDSFLMNMRFGYRFKLRSGRALQAHFDIFNVTNRVNFVTPNNDRRDTATFLILSSTTAPTRTAQFNLKYTF